MQGRSASVKRNVDQLQFCFYTREAKDSHFGRRAYAHVCIINTPYKQVANTFPRNMGPILHSRVKYQRFKMNFRYTLRDLDWIIMYHCRSTIKLENETK